MSDLNALTNDIKSVGNACILDRVCVHTCAYILIHTHNTYVYQTTGESIAAKKADKATKEEIAPLVTELLALKAKYAEVNMHMHIHIY